MRLTRWMPLGLLIAVLLIAGVVGSSPTVAAAGKNCEEAKLAYKLMYDGARADALADSFDANFQGCNYRGSTACSTAIKDFLRKNISAAIEKNFKEQLPDQWHAAGDKLPPPSQFKCP